jgi:hypothetical protein
MIRQGEIYVETQLQRFLDAKEALLKDDANYANHEEKRQDLLKYYNERIQSYECQLAKFRKQRKDNYTATETKLNQNRSHI